MRKSVLHASCIGLALSTMMGCSESTEVLTPVDIAHSNFVDKNNNGELDLYEDESQPRADRVADLVSRLTTEQKIALVSGIGYAMNEKDAQKHKVPGAAGFTAPI